MTIVLLLISCSIGMGQVNFRADLETKDPVDKSANLDFQEKLKLHQAFLDAALREKNQLFQLYGLLYLFYDHIQNEDYAEANRYLLEARALAEEADNPGWQGWVAYRAGVLYVRMDKEAEAIETYQKATEWCSIAGDSLCVGESFEQLSAMNGLLGNYKEAKKYFNRAMPLLEQYGEEKNQATALSNYGSLLIMMGHPKEAIPFLERVIALQSKLKEYRGQAKAMNNLANAYKRLQQYEKAIDLYEACIQLNLEHGFAENRITNYMGLFTVYEAKGDYQSANEFLIKRYELRDSIIGTKTQEKIMELEARFKSEQKELALEKSRSALILAQQKVKTRNVGLFFLFFLMLTGLIFWLRQRKITQKQLLVNKENLEKLTRLLISKNAVLAELEKKVGELQPQSQIASQSSSFDENLYSQRILTKEDWSEFKIFFEKTYPGFLRRLRNSFPDMTEAEERLFLFIKLNLTRKEAADILGISADSVKKNRNRLRKRIELDQEESLEKFIKEF